MGSSDSGPDELEDTSGVQYHRHLFVLLNGKKSGDRHLRSAVKHLRSGPQLASCKSNFCKRDDIVNVRAGKKAIG